jgi:chromosome segregation ATPase
MNKNVVIFILVLFTLLGSIWGSVENRKRISLEQQLQDMSAEIEKIGMQTSKEREQVLGKTAGLQETLADKEEQLKDARKELVALRKSSKAIESQLSGCTASLQEMNEKNESYLQEIQVAKKNIASLQAADDKQQQDSKAQPEEKAGKQPGQAGKGVTAGLDRQDVTSLQNQLQTTSFTVEQLREELNACNAQITGLEKLVDEKNAGMDEISQDMDRLKVNMDVLLSKISDQKDSLQELQEENRDLAKELAAKNEEIADLQEEIMQGPVKKE